MEAIVSEQTFDEAVTTFREALQAFVKGDPTFVLALFSQAEDVTLANPLGPAQRGAAAVAKVASEAASHFEDGHKTFEEVSRFASADLGYVVQNEHAEVRLDGASEASLISLRVTMIFRLESEGWRVAHRHADPITSPRPVASMVSG